NHTITTKRDKFRINQTIMGAGNYDNLGGEKQRNMMGNALMNMSFDQYKYKKIISKGNHKINGKTYYVEKDLYDVLPNDFDKNDSNMNGLTRIKESTPILHQTTKLEQTT